MKARLDPSVYSQHNLLVLVVILLHVRRQLKVKRNAPRTLLSQRQPVLEAQNVFHSHIHHVHHPAFSDLHLVGNLTHHLDSRFQRLEEVGTVAIGGVGVEVHLHRLGRLVGKLSLGEVPCGLVEEQLEALGGHGKLLFRSLVGPFTFGKVTLGCSGIELL